MRHHRPGDRLRAGWIDAIIVWSLAAVPQGMGLVDGEGVWELLIVLLALLIHLPMELRDGRSPGKRLLQIRAATLDLDRPSPSAILIRWVARWGAFLVNGVLLGPFWVPLLAWVVLYVGGLPFGNGRALHDLAAGTIVTHSPLSRIQRAAEDTVPLGMLPRRARRVVD